MHKTPRMRTRSEDRRHAYGCYILYFCHLHTGLLLLFSCFCHLHCLCNKISTGRRLISREDAHPMYPRYPRVFFMLLFTAHSPTNLCEKGWGYHCCVLVWLLALFANLNRFFQKKKVECLLRCSYLSPENTQQR